MSILCFCRHQHGLPGLPLAATPFGHISESGGSSASGGPSERGLGPWTAADPVGLVKGLDWSGRISQARLTSHGLVVPLRAGEKAARGGRPVR